MVSDRVCLHKANPPTYVKTSNSYFTLKKKIYRSFSLNINTYSSVDWLIHSFIQSLNIRLLSTYYGVKCCVTHRVSSMKQKKRRNPSFYVASFHSNMDRWNNKMIHLQEIIEPSICFILRSWKLRATEIVSWQRSYRWVNFLSKGSIQFLDFFSRDVAPTINCLYLVDNAEEYSSH